MLGFSYGEIFLLLGATAALIGPKDLPIIARTAGRLAGRAIGYVQLTRGQFENVLQQSQARQVHKELQDAMAQLDAIRHEIRSVSMINPGPLARRVVDYPDHPSNLNDIRKPENTGGENNLVNAVVKDSALPALHSSNMHSQTTSYAKLADSPAIKNGLSTVEKDSALPASPSSNMHSQAISFANLAESPAIKNGLSASSTEMEGKDESQLIVLPVSAEDTGVLPKRGADVKGSDIVLEAILEAEVAHNAKEFFSQPQNQI